MYAVVDYLTPPDAPFGDEVERFIWREDAERFIRDIRRDDPELARTLRIEERELAPAPEGLN